MKTRNLLLALGCAAALTACTTNDEPAVAPVPAMRTVTLSVDVNEPADTRVSYVKEGTTYKFAWSDDDMLRVFYNDGSNEVYADFTIDKNSIDGKKANFTSADFPEKFTGDVTIVYSGSGLTFVDADSNGMHNDLMLTGYFGQTTSVAADLAYRTLLYAKAVVNEEGKLPDVKLNHALSYLLLKQGLQVTQEDLNVGEGDTELLLEVGTAKGLSFSSSGCNISDTDGSVFGDIYVTKGKLVSDCLVPLFIGSESATNGYTVSGYFLGSTDFSYVYQPDFTYEAGKIYVVEEGNEKWLPVTVAVPEAEVIDLSTVTDHVAIPENSLVEVKGGDGSKNVTVGAGSKVILNGATMNRLVLEGDAKFVLEGNNKVTYDVRNSTGIVLSSESKVIIQGPGTLTKVGGWNGIQGAEMSGNADVIVESGTLVIEGNWASDSGHAASTAMNVKSLTVRGGKVVATGGMFSSDYYDSYAGAIVVSENVLISGGEVTAKGNGGIRAGGSITITDGIVYAKSLPPRNGPLPGIYAGEKLAISGGTVTAEGTVSYYGDQGQSGIFVEESGEIEITGGTVVATGAGGSAGIGSSEYTRLSCGKITISGGTVTAVGDGGGAGIGTSSNASSKCGDITIGSGVTKVTATKGSGATDSIGKGSADSTVGTITIDDGANVEQN